MVITAQLGNNQPTTFDLADLVKEWINGTNVASNGFMMKGVNENTVNKAFCSTEFGTVSMRPYMTLNYTPVIDVVSSTSTVFMLFDEEDDNIGTRDENSIEVLMHELNHQLGAPDHYHEEDSVDDDKCINSDYCWDCGDDKRPFNCIMVNSSNDSLCDGCRNDIIAYLKSHSE